jgi:hypothetical protein
MAAPLFHHHVVNGGHAAVDHCGYFGCMDLHRGGYLGVL